MAKSYRKSTSLSYYDEVLAPYWEGEYRFNHVDFVGKTIELNFNVFEICVLHQTRNSLIFKGLSYLEIHNRRMINFKW